MSKPVYLFIDESGDPGDNDGTGDNTLHYAELAFQIEHKHIEALVGHIINWRYIENLIREPKTLPTDETKRNNFLKPIVELHQAGAIKCTAVYLLKDKYTGPYLKENKPILFRNFVHRQLLKHHFNIYPTMPDDYVVAIFDYFRMSRSDFRNVNNYLCNICGFPLDNIVHLDSKCSWLLQTTGQVVNAVSYISLGKAPRSMTKVLSFISLKDITQLI